ncbi:hypothetical protein ACFQ0T_35885 [Kitasatospora gansuensis]
MTGLLAVPAAADTAPPVGPVADRVKAVAAWQAGGPPYAGPRRSRSRARTRM